MYTYSKEILPNGLRILYIQMPHIHSVVMAAYVGVGSRYEVEEKLGLSHLLEHMLFRGPRGFRSSFELLQTIDDIGGELDAYTSPEHSAILIQVHKKHCKQGLEILGDILLGGKFRHEDMETEKHIVQEEISQFMDNKGDYICIDDLSYNLMWKKGSMNAASFGDRKTIARISREDLEGHYSRFFVPENVVLCMSGNFDKEEASLWVRNIFENFQGKLDVEKPGLSTDQKAPRCIFKKVHSQMIHFKLCHKAYPYKHPNVLIMLLITDVLGGGISSRLLSNVRERLGLVYEITSYPTLFSDVGSIDIYTSTKRTNFGKTARAIMDEVHKLVEYGISPEELRKTEERVFSQMQLTMDSPLGMANWFGTEELMIRPEKPDTPEVQAEKVHNIRLEEVSRVVKDIFVPEKRNLVVVGAAGWWERRKVRRLLE
ncbi:MAG TPA: M16 family metallopeptidase [Candidatus Hypogeohydataceae bacterium YC38]|nr:pitrilysin family protein [Candidatus Brocadiales bacterium]